MTLPDPLTTPVVSVSSAGVLPACLIHPPEPSGLAPLMVLHGISRNADQMAAPFRPEAAPSSYRISAPKAGRISRGQAARRVPIRPCWRICATRCPGRGSGRGPVDLFDHSGGAQLAHRFAMLYAGRSVGCTCRQRAGIACRTTRCPIPMAWPPRAGHRTVSGRGVT